MTAILNDFLFAKMFCHIINRFLTRTRNIVHFGVTLNMLFTYLPTVFCLYIYIQSYIHTTYIHVYIQTYTYTYILIHAYLHMYIILARILIYICIQNYTYPWYLHVNINIYTHTYMHIHTCIQLYIHELSMSYACIKYTYIAYIHICVLVEFCASF